MPDLSADLKFLDGGGEATRLILARDWSSHPLGHPGGWPEALKASLSLVLNSPESMILCWDRDSLFFFFNETYIPLLGPRVSWAMGALFSDVWADGLDQARPIIAEAFAGNSRRFVDLPWKLDTDRGAADTWWSFSYSRILDAAGEIAGLFIFTNETTQRVLTDRALSASQAELRALNETLERRVEERTAERDRMWNTSPDLMVSISPDGLYQRVNPAWTEVLGYEARDLIGLDTKSLSHPDEIDITLEAWDTARSGSLPNFENRLRHRDGTYRWMQWVAARGPSEIFAIGRHVTAAKEAELALKAAEEALRQAQKMEAVGQLTGGLAHDFNNLLAGVTGSLELLGTRMAQGRMAEADRYLEAAQGATRRAAALTHRLLAFSRQQTLAPTPTDVNALVAGLLDLVQRTVGPAIQIETQAEPDLWPALVDQSQLENALINLCINARDAMPDGGRIVIKTGNFWIASQTANPHELPEGEYLALCVADTGSGMSKAVIEKAFDPFFTTKPIGQGTGLGLSMIYGFAKQSGGEVRIVSEEGHGATVCIYLPRHRGAVEVIAAPAPAPKPATSGAGETVLVVDDEPLVRMLVTDALEDLGYQVLEASDGAEGIGLVTSGRAIDLLITDVGLPGGMNGRQVAEAARTLRPGLKVLFITGYAENAVLNSGHLEPGMGVLTKPFTMDTLASRVSRLIDE